MDQVPDLVYFLVTLVVALLGIWLSHKHFLAQQQDKFHEISREIREIREYLGRMSEATSERSSKREEQLFSLIRFSFGIGAKEASEDIRALVQEELKASGVSAKTERLDKIEREAGQIIIKSAKWLDDAPGVDNSKFPDEFNNLLSHHVHNLRQIRKGGSQAGIARNRIAHTASEVYRNLESEFTLEEFASTHSIKDVDARTALGILVMWKDLVKTNGRYARKTMWEEG